MSTFGKKAIKYWDYQWTEDKAMRFNKTQIDRILEYTLIPIKCYLTVS